MQGFSKAPVELDGVKHEPIWPYGRAWLTIVNAVQAAVMVAIAQLVEHRVVVAGVAGSSPVSHPSQSLGTEVPRLFSSHRNSSSAATYRHAYIYDGLLLIPPEVSPVPVSSSLVQELQLSVPGWLHGNPLHRAGCPRGRTGMSKRSCKSMDPVAQTHWDPVRNIPMSTHRGNTGTGTSDNVDPTDGWGEVPEADRPLWSRYMLDHCPAFPGATIMTFIAGSVVKGGTRVPQSWKDTAAELHTVGFSPIQYFLLAELLTSARKQGELQETLHGHLFKEWFGDPYPDFRLNADAWRPWLQRLQNAQSPSRALSHILHGWNLPPLGTVRFTKGGNTQVVSD